MESDNSASVSNQGGKSSGSSAVKLPNGMLDPTPGDSVQKIVNNNKLGSPLLRLPAELRNLIFAYTLGGRHIVVSQKKPKKDGSQQGPCAKMRDLSQKMEDGLRFTHFEPHFLSLLCVCRQIYSEAALLPFSVNHFWIKSEKALESWKEHDHVLSAQINAIRICQFWVYMRSSVEALSALPAVKKVYIMSWSGMEFLSHQWVKVISKESKEAGEQSAEQHVFQCWDGFSWYTQPAFVDKDLVEDDTSSNVVKRRIRESVNQGAEVIFVYGKYPQPKRRPLPWADFF